MAHRQWKLNRRLLFSRRFITLTWAWKAFRVCDTQQFFFISHFCLFMGLLFDTSDSAFLFCRPRPHQSLEWHQFIRHTFGVGKTGHKQVNILNVCVSSCGENERGREKVKKLLNVPAFISKYVWNVACNPSVFLGKWLFFGEVFSRWFRT